MTAFNSKKDRMEMKGWQILEIDKRILEPQMTSRNLRQQIITGAVKQHVNNIESKCSAAVHVITLTCANLKRLIRENFILFILFYFY